MAPYGRGATTISANWVTGPIPRRTTYEDTGGPFYQDAGFTQPDLIHDDQALWLESKSGIVVLLGCAHAGVVNTLNYIVELTGETSIHAVIGGMHLLRAQRPRLDGTGARRTGGRQGRLRRTTCASSRGRQAWERLSSHRRASRRPERPRSWL